MVNDALSGNADRYPVCALPADEFSHRLRAWREVSNRALSRTVGTGRASSTFPRSVLEDLEPLIAAEAKCCPSLTFDVQERGEIVEMELNFPPALGPMVTVLLGEDHAVH